MKEVEDFVLDWTGTQTVKSELEYQRATIARRIDRSHRYVFFWTMKATRIKYTNELVAAEENDTDRSFNTRTDIKQSRNGRNYLTITIGVVRNGKNYIFFDAGSPVAKKPQHGEKTKSKDYHQKTRDTRTPVKTK